MTSTALSSPLVLLDPENPAAARPYHGLHAVSPILLGFATPFVVLLLIAPHVVLSLGPLAYGLLNLTVLASGAIFIHGVFNRGKVAAVAIDPERRVVDIIETGTFARAITSLPFDSITAYRVTTHYDREGNCFPRSQIVLRTGESVIVPIVPNANELAIIRAIIGR